MIQSDSTHGVRSPYLLILLVALAACSNAGYAQTGSTGTLTSAEPVDYAKLAEQFEHGYQQWFEQLKQANAAGDNESATRAFKNQQAYYEAKQVAELAQLKSRALGGEVQLLPTPGAGTIADAEKAMGGARVAGDFDPAVNIHKSESESPLSRLYQDYIYAMKYWYDSAIQVKALNPSRFETAVKNAQAFEDAYLSIKNAAMQAEAAGQVVEVTPVPRLPHYPYAPPQIISTPAVTPIPTPAPSAIAGLATATTDIAAPVATPLPTPEMIVIPSGAKVVQLNDRSFPSKTRRGTWVVEFGATWCGPCKKMKPIMDAVAFEEGGDVTFAAVDVDLSPKTKQRYGVTAFPTFVLMKNGAVAAKKVGGMSKEKLKQFASQ